MPRYEFFCDDCQKPFEIILTLAEYEKGKIKCPKCGGKHVHHKDQVEGAEDCAGTLHR